jgi:hypothetical protein
VTSTLLLAALCLVPGLPAAVLLARWRGERAGPAVLAAEGLLLGTAWYLAVGIVLAHAGALGRVQVAAPTLVLVAALAVPAWRARPLVDRPRVTTFGVALAAVLVVALVLRRHPFYFLYQIADFGEYVNRANVLAAGGPFTEWFTHGFSVLLALSNVALGQAGTVDAVPFLGMLVLTTVVAIGTRLGFGAWPRLAVATVLAVGVVPVWFSRFPASETLYAVLQLAMLLQLVAAVQRRHHPTALVAGGFAFLLMLTRGNALLLAPLLLVSLAVASILLSRPALRVMATFTAASLAGLFAGFVYNSRYSYAYFIEFQMPQFFPDAVWRRFDDLGGLTAAVPKGALVAAVVALAVVATRWLNDRLGPPADHPALRVIRPAVLPVAVAAGAASLWWPLDPHGALDALGRYDPTVVVLAALGLAGATAAIARPLAAGEADARRALLVPAVLVAVAFVALHAYRFPTPRYAPYYLYWDRYLWSEVLPLVLLVGLWGVALVEAAVAWAARRGGALRPAGIAAAGVAGGLALWSVVAAGDLSRQRRFLGDAYGQMDRLRAATLLAGDLPVVYAGVDPDEDLVLHTNTYRLFALPLAETFGARVVNIAGLHPYGPDPRPSAEEVAALLRERGIERAVLVTVDDPGEPVPLAGGALATRRLDRVDIEIPILDRPVGREPDGWTDVRVRLTVHEVVPA